MVSLSRPSKTYFSVIRPLTNSPRVANGHRTSGPSIQYPTLTGDLEGGLVVTRTPDLRPELQWSWPGAPAASIQLTPDGGVTVIPWPIAGEGGVDLVPGQTYTVVGQAQNSEGDLVDIGGSITITGGYAKLLRNGLGKMNRNGTGKLLRKAA